LQVGIKDGDYLAAGLIEAAGDGELVAKIPREAHDLYEINFLREGAQ
jgi:hypothetical protein